MLIHVLARLELTEKLNELEPKYCRSFNGVYEAIIYLLKKDDQQTHQQERTRIGYKK